MIGDILQPTHLLFVLVIALLVLGPKRLPEVGRALGRGLRDFRNALSTNELHDQMISTTDTESQPQVEQAPPPAAEAPVTEPAHQPAATPEPPSADDSDSSAQEPIHSPEPTAPAPTSERVP